MRILVLGGARSGKSAWAERLLTDERGVDYVATARPFPGASGFDADFSARIAEHRLRRPASWRTVDDVDAVAALRRPSPGNHVLLDDVGTWLTGIFDREGLWDSPRGTVHQWCDELVGAVREWPVGKHGDTAGGEVAGPGAAEGGGGATGPGGGARLVIVTPEVGMGVIPEHRSGRLFRDEIGLLNGRLAEVCDLVTLVVAGCPVTVKGPGINY